jgi:LysM repeat protein
MTSATTPTPQPLQPSDSLPTSINISPSQRLEHLPIAALLAFVPRMRTTYRVVTRKSNKKVATSRTHYQIRLATGNVLHVSDNLLDLIRLIDGRRNVQAVSDALAQLQGRPVHPAEIVYLLRHRLSPAGLVELSFPPALPEPKTTQPLSLAEIRLAGESEAQPMERDTESAPTGALVPIEQRERALISRKNDVQWIPPGRRAERLRTTRRQSPLAHQRRRASYISLIATLLIVVTAGTAFAFGQAGFSHASFTLPGLSALFGGTTPTPGIVPTFTPTPTPPPHPNYYVVQDGDTLPKIAARFRVTTGALVIVNKLGNDNAITTGQILIIPTVYYAGADIAHLPYPFFYTVQQGDTIYSIASIFGVSFNDIISYNHIQSTQAGLIHPGDWLVIPAPGTVQQS